MSVVPVVVSVVSSHISCSIFVVNQIVKTLACTLSLWLRSINFLSSFMVAVVTSVASVRPFASVRATRTAVMMTAMPMIARRVLAKIMTASSSLDASALCSWRALKLRIIWQLNNTALAVDNSYLAIGKSNFFATFMAIPEDKEQDYIPY